MKAFFTHFLKNKSGVTVDEYLLIVAIIWVAITIGVQVVTAGAPSDTLKTDKANSIGRAKGETT